MAENNYIQSIIYTVRGQKVMIDSDLAAIYGYETKAFNQQVKNNIQKFDDDFRFQLTKEEYHEILKSKILTLKTNKTISFPDNNEREGFLRSNFLTLELQQGKYSKYLPHAFTEQGIYMLMTVLKGELAVRQSKALIRTFKEMKDFIIDNKSLIGNRELLQLSMQTTKNTEDIAEIKRNMATRAELSRVIHDFTDPQTRREYLILNGESFDANIAYSKIYASAQKSVFVIDNYIGVKTLELLKNAPQNVAVTIFSDNAGHRLSKSDYDDFANQFPQVNISFIKTCGIFHDRYIVIDYDASTEKIYHCGASSKDAGNKVTSITQISECSVYHQIINALLQNPTLILS